MNMKTSETPITCCGYSIEDATITKEIISQNDELSRKVKRDYNALKLFLKLSYSGSNLLKEKPQYFDEDFREEFLAKYYEELNVKFFFRTGKTEESKEKVIEDIIFSGDLYETVKEYFEQEVLKK